MAELIYKQTDINGENFTLEPAGELVRCKDCKYYDNIEDAEKPGYRECHYFSNWASAHYMLPIDFCSCAKRKR